MAVQHGAYTRPLVPLTYHEPQLEFLKARRAWVCRNDQHFKRPHIFQRVLPDTLCPACGSPPIMHAYHRLMTLAGRRGGKTRVGALGVIEEAAIPNSLIWVVAPTFKNIHDYVWPAIKAQIPREWLVDPNHPVNETYQEMPLINGSMIQARSAEDPQSLRGQGIQAVWLDEAAQIAVEAWDVLSPSLAESRGIAWFTTTPFGFDWTYDRIELLAKAKRPGYWFAEWESIDNPAIPQWEKDEAKATLPEDLFDQEWRAKRVQFSGAIYGRSFHPYILDTDEQIKRLIPEWPQLDQSRTGYLGIDPGAGNDHPYAAVAAVATEKGFVRYAEYLERSPKSTYEHAQAIKVMCRGLQLRTGIDRRRRQDQTELSRYGIYATQIGGDVMGELNTMRSQIHKGQSWFIRSSVPTLIRQMESYRYADPKKADGSIKPQPIVFKKDEDLCDADRYGYDVAGSLPTPPPQPTTGRNLDTDPVPADLYQSWLREQRFDGKMKDPNDGLEPMGAEYPLSDFFQ